MSLHIDAIGAVLFAVALVLSFFLCKLTMRSGIVDAPDGLRKLQTAPVPRIGGAAIFGATLLVALPAISFVWPGFALTPMIRTLAALVGICFLVGLWDDLTDPPAIAKLGMLGLACFGAPALGLLPEEFTTPFGEIDISLFLIVGSGLWLLVITNAANFMDGANGLSIGSLAIMLIGLAVTAGAAGAFGPSYLWLILLGAIGGFLVLNLGGKLYAGDGGALGLGGLFGGLGLVSGLDIWSVATLALPFLIDVLATLVWRGRHGRSWLQAHRDHAYQCLLKDGWGHMDVALLYWGLSGVCGLAAFIGAQAGGAAPFMLFWALGLTGIYLWTRIPRQ